MEALQPYKVKSLHLEFARDVVDGSEVTGLPSHNVQTVAGGRTNTPCLIRTGYIRKMADGSAKIFCGNPDDLARQCWKGWK